MNLKFSDNSNNFKNNINNTEYSYNNFEGMDSWARIRPSLSKNKEKYLYKGRDSIVNTKKNEYNPSSNYTHFYLFYKKKRWPLTSLKTKRFSNLHRLVSLIFIFSDAHISTSWILMPTKNA